MLDSRWIVIKFARLAGLRDGGLDKLALTSKLARPTTCLGRVQKPGGGEASWLMVRGSTSSMLNAI